MSTALEPVDVARQCTGAPCPRNRVPTTLESPTDRRYAPSLPRAPVASSASQHSRFWARSMQIGISVIQRQSRRHCHTPSRLSRRCSMRTCCLLRNAVSLLAETFLSACRPHKLFSCRVLFGSKDRVYLATLLCPSSRGVAYLSGNVSPIWLPFSGRFSPSSRRFRTCWKHWKPSKG
jgi:hypothetical protein